MCKKAIAQSVKLMTLDRLVPSARYTKDQISPYFWLNGKMSVREDWKRLAAENFQNFKLKVSDMVENPAALSTDDLRAIATEQQITMHHCVQGWSGLAQCRGVPSRNLIEYVRPLPYAKTIVFWSFGESL